MILFDLDWKVCRMCAGDLSFIQISCAAGFVSPNNRAIVSFVAAENFAAGTVVEI